TGAPMVVNLESGNFDGAGATRFDLELDRRSERPGEQQLEKMVAGRYLGELLRLVLDDLRVAGRIRFDRAHAPGPAHGAAKVLGARLAGADDRAAAAALALAFGWEGADGDAIDAARAAATCLLQRSAALAAATFAGAILRLDPELRQRHVVAVDGSVYAREP